MEMNQKELKHNDLEREIKRMAAEKGTTLGEAAKNAGTSGSYVSRLLKKNPVNPVFENLVEELGYEIKLEYVKKASGEDKEK